MGKIISDREFEVVEHLVYLGSKKETAPILKITERSLETHTKNIYRKLGITKLNELVLWYCGIMFNIAEEIKERQKEILSIALLIFSSYAIYPGTTDMQIRNTRTQRTCAAEITNNRLRTRRRERDIPINNMDHPNTIAA